MRKEVKLDLSGKTRYVYFIQCGDNGPIKIGTSKALRNRFVTIQCDNPCVVFLRCAFEGGRNEEFQLHKQFDRFKIIGEWFKPEQELLDFMSNFERLDYVAADFQKIIKRGSECHNWKGELAGESSKRQRARAFTRYKKHCDRCGKGKGLDTVYKDGNRDNLNPENLALYCRRCRMEADGTLDNLLKIERKTSPLQECSICKVMVKRISKGKCHACEEFFRRNGYERSEYLLRDKTKEMKTCSICGKPEKVLALNRCHSCYEFFRRNGFERSELQHKYSEKDLESDEIKKLKEMIGITTLEKAQYIRQLYNTGKFSRRFLSKCANLSYTYCAQIISGLTFPDPIIEKENIITEKPQCVKDFYRFSVKTNKLLSLSDSAKLIQEIIIDSCNTGSFYIEYPKYHNENLSAGFIVYFENEPVKFIEICKKSRFITVVQKLSNKKIDTSKITDVQEVLKETAEIISSNT